MIPEQLFAEHRDVLQAFLGRARRVDRSRWRTKPAEGKWSPAEVCEHVALVYEALLSEAVGGAPMRIRTSWWQRIFLRVAVLPGIIRNGAFPSGAPAPRESRPLAVPASCEAVLERMQRAAESIEERLRAAPGLRLTHPYFGKVTARQAVRFLAVHTAHHARQLP